MDTPRDNQDRLMKLMLSCPRMLRDLLALLPAEWTAAVDAASLRELPTEFIGARGEKRIADLCWLAEGGEPAIILIENQSTPDRRMPARATTRIGLLYESLGSAALGPDGRFPLAIIVVVYTGHRPWRPPDDLSALVRVPAGHPLPWLTGRRYARLDLRDPATQYPKRGNRMAALARLMFAESPFDAIHVLNDVAEWLDFGDEDEQRLYRCYVNLFYAITPKLRPRDWDPEREREVEELMRELTALERNTERWLEGHRRTAFADGRREGHADGRRQGHADGQREALVRLAARRFGVDIGRRLQARLRSVKDPSRLDRVGDLIVDSETGEQLLGGLDGVGINSS